MAGKLTTHVLDTAQGRPAGGMTIQLWRIEQHPPAKKLLQTFQTNADGRIDNPLLFNEEFQVGIYELVFAVGEYFAQTAIALPNPPFLDQVPLRFGIADPNAHYHVPLLVSPWSYSTYRGS
jgi:5-hydroxyisourate hydrolase